MRIQKSNFDCLPTLYLVPVPIGNFLDMTYRGVKILKEVDCIYCEDTRVSKILLSHFDIKTPARSYHVFNEKDVLKSALMLLGEGKNIALISDAGFPAISDPGFLLASKAIENGYNVVGIPGASASLTALVASGIPCEKFFFNGFLPRKDVKRRKTLNALKVREEAIIFFESPHRIKETLNDIYDVMGNRTIAIARELTKEHEEYVRGTIREIIELDLEMPGEIVVIVSGAKNMPRINDKDKIMLKYQTYVAQGMKKNDAAKKIAEESTFNKREIYKMLLAEEGSIKKEDVIRRTKSYLAEGYIEKDAVRLVADELGISLKQYYLLMQNQDKE